MSKKKRQWETEAAQRQETREALRAEARELAIRETEALERIATALEAIAYPKTEDYTLNYDYDKYNPEGTGVIQSALERLRATAVLEERTEDGGYYTIIQEAGYTDEDIDP